MADIIAYYRVSTKQQGDSGLGLDAQKTAVEAYAKNAGAKILASYREVESGKLAERPELALRPGPCPAKQGNAGCRQAGPPGPQRGFPVGPDAFGGGFRLLRQSAREQADDSYSGRRCGRRSRADFGTDESRPASGQGPRSEARIGPRRTIGRARKSPACWPSPRPSRCRQGCFRRAATEAYADLAPMNAAMPGRWNDAGSNRRSAERGRPHNAPRQAVESRSSKRVLERWRPSRRE